MTSVTFQDAKSAHITLLHFCTLIMKQEVGSKRSLACALLQEAYVPKAASSRQLMGIPSTESNLQNKPASLQAIKTMRRE